MAIIVKNKNIKEEIVDENGTILGYISYNPNDTKNYTLLSDALKNINNIHNKIKNIKNLKEIPKEGLRSVDDFEEYQNTLDQINETLHYQDEQIENIKNNINIIFGDNTCDIIMGNSNDIELLMPLLENVMPKFEAARKNKLSEYLETENNENGDVME